MGPNPVVRFATSPDEQAEAQEARMHAALAAGLAVISDYFAIEALTRREPPCKQQP